MITLKDDRAKLFTRSKEHARRVVELSKELADLQSRKVADSEAAMTILGGQGISVKQWEVKLGL